MGRIIKEEDGRTLQVKAMVQKKKKKRGRVIYIWPVSAKDLMTLVRNIINTKAIMWDPVSPR